MSVFAQLSDIEMNCSGVSSALHACLHDDGVKKPKQACKKLSENDTDSTTSRTLQQFSSADLIRAFLYAWPHLNHTYSDECSTHEYNDNIS
eukprot:3852994-Prorocentrum_lima.AAC.1